MFLSGTLVLEYGATSENIYAGMNEEYAATVFSPHLV